ncbi:fibronectin type III domain-containing protein [Paenibacillus polysaccharolyticus]|uniref:RCC1 domain-containing protein n=1 Tax=Paenibacillus polysaccharolyticus TaxID=582692 RepID=UPI00209E5918|nr:fibronectin type III domain-containing protein [Paenibacillus polysaccharolyticus]MCP1132779.1 fibronectin type III domain-containing protein [Paenibacillus polysaccharolyticus]
MKIKVAVKLLISLSLILTMGFTSTIQAEESKADKAVNQISIGWYHFSVLGRDGTIWSAGANNGQMGSETDEVIDLKPLTNSSDIASVYAGPFTNYGINKNGKVVSWQHSNSVRNSSSVFSSLENVKKLVEGLDSYAVLTTEGNVWMWGTGNAGQLGQGDLKPRDVPTLVPNLEKITDVAIVLQSTFAIQEDGTLWGWGANNVYQGNGITDKSLVPVRIDIPVKIKHIYSNTNTNTVAAIDVNNDVWMWGSNADGQLGNGTKVYRKFPAINDVLGKVKQLALGRYHVIALKQDGTVWAWGNNASGQLGDGTTLERLSPVQVLGLSEVDSIAAGSESINGAVSKSSQIYIWGQAVRSLSDFDTKKILTTPQLITIDDEPKVTAPINKPENLKLKVVNSSSVQLSWDQPKAQNELEYGYNIYQNNVMIGSTKEKNFIINNLDATKEYNFYIKAKATSGQESEASNTVKKRGIGKYTYVYNSSGQLTSIIYESGKRISYEYDKNGNLKKTTVVNP